MANSDKIKILRLKSVNSLYNPNFLLTFATSKDKNIIQLKTLSVYRLTALRNMTTFEWFQNEFAERSNDEQVKKR